MFKLSKEKQKEYDKLIRPRSERLNPYPFIFCGFMLIILFSIGGVVSAILTLVSALIAANNFMAANDAASVGQKEALLLLRDEEKKAKDKAELVRQAKIDAEEREKEKVIEDAKTAELKVKKEEEAARKAKQAERTQDQQAHIGDDLRKFTLNVLEKSKEVPVIVDYWAPWCAPCKQISPVLERYVLAAGGKVQLVKINMDEEANQQLMKELPDGLKVTSIPTVIAFFNGQGVDALIGASSQNKIEEFVDRISLLAPSTKVVRNTNSKQSSFKSINIEEFFSSRTNILKVKCYVFESNDVVFIFSKSLHEMNNREIYALKISMLKLNERKLDEKSYEKEIMPLVYNDGKCKISIISSDPHAHYMTPHLKDHIPKSERKTAEIINSLQDMNAETCQRYEELAFEINSSGDFQKAEIGEAFNRSSDGYQLFLGADGEENIFLDSEKSIITMAAPGSGKTQCHVLPALSQYKGAAIVLDIKGECFLNTGRWRKENVGPVLAFTPAHPDKSAKYNPLSFISQDHDKVWENARLLAEMLVVKHSTSDPSWETQGRQLLTLLIAYVAFGDDEKRTMTTVLDLISEMGLEEAFDDVLEEGAPFPSSMRRTANKFKKMQETSEKQFQGVLSGASQHLTVWEGSAVEKITASSDWAPEDFRKTPPTTLYLCVPPNAIDTYAPLLRVIIGQHVRELMKEEPDREAPPILFMLDELPRLGNMQPIREALEVGRSYGIKLWMFAQFAGQLREAYGRDIADGMIESCGARIYMNAGADTAERLAKTLGTRENLLTGKTEPVVTPQELMGPEWRDDMLVFATGEPPLRLKKVFFHEQTAEDTTH